MLFLIKRLIYRYVVSAQLVGSSAWANLQVTVCRPMSFYVGIVGGKGGWRVKKWPDLTHL